MSLIARFAAYAAAFEEAVVSDDWSTIEPYFSEDAVYEIGMPIFGAERCEGREAVLVWFAESLDRLDRRFASRALALLDGPREENGAVWLRGTATYTADGVPDFVLELEEIVTFEGDRISRLEDRYTPEMQEATRAYIERYGPALGMPLLA